MKSKHFVSGLLIFLFGAGSGNQQVMAEEKTLPLLSESEFYTDIPSIESVTRLPQSRSETPAAITLIDRDMIRHSGARYLVDLFRLVPGFQVAYPRQDRPIVTYHGLGDVNARRLLILIDGRSFYGAFGGQINWLNTGIALQDIERIEVIRGPNTVTYGDNAFLATVNIITRHAAQVGNGAVNLSAGNHDIGDVMARYASHFELGDIRLSAGYQSEDGFDVRPDDFQSRSFNLRADLQPTTSDSFLLQFGIVESDAGVGNPNSIFFPPSEFERSDHFEQIRWRHQIAEDNELSLHFYHNQGESDFDLLSKPINAGPLGQIQIPFSLDIAEERFDLELQHVFRPWNSLRLVWGLGIREDSTESLPVFNSNETFTNRSSRLFSSTGWQVTTDTTVNAGLLWEDNNLTGDDLSPRLALNHQLGNLHTIRAAWSLAQRIPSLGETQIDSRITFMGILANQVLINQFTLDNETMESFELGYLGRFPTAHLTFDIRLFHDQIKDYITHTEVVVDDLFDDRALAFRNEGDIDIEGIDLELSYQPDRDTRIVLSSAFMSASARNFSNLAVFTAQQYEESVPTYSGSLLYIQKLNHWFASLGLYWVDDMLWLNQSLSNNQPAVDSYTRLDIRLARQIKISGTRGELALVVQNAGDDYQDFRRRNLFDTHAFVTLKMEF